MKALTIFCFILFLAGVAAFLGQMWFSLWSSGIFLKIIITDVALFAIAFVLAFLIKENKESKNIHNGDLQ